jgi:hypothetical protein
VGPTCQSACGEGEGGLRRGRFPAMEAEIGQGTTGSRACWADGERWRLGKEWASVEGLGRLGQNPRRVL